MQGPVESSDQGTGTSTAIELAQGIAENAGSNLYAPAALAILAVTFVVPLIFCIVYYAKADVHSGS